MLILTKEQLIQEINQRFSPKYVFFWGHQPPKNQAVSKSCFSQWFASPFTVDDVTYPTAEHYMMAQKARLFNDSQTLIKILHSTHPGEAKRLGREILHFDEVLWGKNRFDIAYQGNLAKFTQHRALGEFLVNTHDRVLVEASPVDSIWGIGLDEAHPSCTNPALWPGLNLLGFVLMKVRAHLKG
ncbi:MAG: NADAR family protein [Candidatus Berkiella sp.]